MTRSKLAKIEKIPLNQPRYDCGKEVLTIPDPSTTGLAEADLVLVVGQGANSKATVDVLQGIADSIGAELGVSRPVVMNAWTDINRLIGTSGLILSPKLCIAAGVSGTGVFSVGIKSSECIVAINTDSKAPIFQIADVGIVGDLLAVLSELAEVITAEKTRKERQNTRGSRNRAR
jgi:electron transfer flavoprotein alpha subunit